MASQDTPPPLQWNFNLLNYSFQSHSLDLFLLLIISSIILLVVFIYFYFHLVQQYSRFSTNPNLSATSTAAAPHASSLVPVLSLGLDSAAIDSLPIFQHQSRPPASSEVARGGESVQESECSICLGVFEDDEMIKVLPKCNHAYHSGCVDEWLSSRSSCPLCRNSLQI